MMGKATGRLTAFIFLLMLPLLLIVSAGDVNLSLPLIPVGLIVIYSSAHMAYLASSPLPNIVTTTFWTFGYLFLGIAPLLQLATNIFPWPGTYDVSVLVKTALLVLVGFLAFDFGRHLIPAQGIGIPKALQRPINEPIIAVLAFISLASIPYLLSRTGGAAVLFAARSERSEALMSELELPVMMLLTNMLSTPVYILLVASLAVWIGRRTRGSFVGIGWKMMVFVLLLATFILNNPISTARLKVGTILVSLFFVLPWRRWSGAATIASLVFGIIFVFPFADLFRNSLDARLSDRLAGSSTITELTGSGNFDAFQMVANTVDALDEHADFQLGRQIGGAILFWVPRSVWPGKPIATGQLVAEKQGYFFTNLSSPLWAEFYVDGGWFLIVVGFIGYGYLVRTIDRWYASSHKSRNVRVISVIVPIFAGYQFFLLRGSLMPAIAYFTPMLLVALLCSVRIGRRRMPLTRTTVGPTIAPSGSTLVKPIIKSHHQIKRRPSKS